MKTLFFSMLCFVTTLSMASIEPTVGGEIDLEASTISWVGKKVTGKHEGMIKLKSASVKMDQGNFIGGSFVIDMTSITCTDLAPDQGGDKLVGHLSSDEFFGIENHPTAELNITKVTPRGSNYEVTADLTIKGQTHPVDFMVNITGNTANADIKVDRTLYGIKYGSGSFFDGLGDNMIYDIFDLSVKLVMKKG